MFKQAEAETADRHSLCPTGVQGLDGVTSKRERADQALQYMKKFRRLLGLGTGRKAAPDQVRTAYSAC